MGEIINHHFWKHRALSSKINRWTNLLHDGSESEFKTDGYALFIREAVNPKLIFRMICINIVISIVIVRGRPIESLLNLITISTQPTVLLYLNTSVSPSPTTLWRSPQICCAVAVYLGLSLVAGFISYILLIQQILILTVFASLLGYLKFVPKINIRWKKLGFRKDGSKNDRDINHVEGE